MANTEKPSAEKRTDSKKPIHWHRVLEVPFAEKDQAKAAGARWDAESKRWYAPPEANLEKLSKWMITMLDVPFAEKDLAKAAGARWNREASFWFAPADAELDKLDKWIITVLDVPFAEKDLAKAAGARWNNELKLWFAPPGTDLTKLDRWLPTKHRTVSAPDLDTKHAVLDVPYKEKDEAKKAGARWNKNQLVWYAPGGADLEKLNKWIPTPARAQEILDAASKKRAELAQEPLNKTAAKKPSEGPKQPVDPARVLEVPFKEKDLAKAAGARWDSDLKMWFIPDGLDEALFARWKRSESTLDLNQAPSTPPFRTPTGGPSRPNHDFAGEDPSTLAEVLDAEGPQETVNSPTLNAMGIRPETLNAGVFRHTWRTDERAETALFPHHLDAPRADGKAPEPKRGRPEYEEYAANHQRLPDDARGFWESNGATRNDVKRIVVVERAIDALSYHQINPDEHALYISTGGGPLTPAQQAALREGNVLTTMAKDATGNYVSAIPKGLVVVAAFSNSNIGAQLARELKECLPPGVTYERNAPTHGRHWNDTLQLKERDYIRSQGVKQKSKGLARSR